MCLDDLITKTKDEIAGILKNTEFKEYSKQAYRDIQDALSRRGLI
jgi:hypothetical protein